MTVQKQGLRAIIFHGEEADAEGLSAFRLLSELGHSVTPTHSTDDAVRLLRDGEPDLLIVDAPSADEDRFVDVLSQLPDSGRPREVAIFSDRLHDPAGRLKKQFGASKVHVFLKPLHVHGLLNVLRQLEADSDRDFLH